MDLICSGNSPGQRKWISFTARIPRATPGIQASQKYSLIEVVGKDPVTSDMNFCIDRTKIEHHFFGCATCGPDFLRFFHHNYPNFSPINAKLQV